MYGGSKREDMRAYYSKMLSQDRATEEIAHLHQGIHELLQELDMIQSQCFNAEVLSMAKKHLITATSTVKEPLPKTIWDSYYSHQKETSSQCQPSKANSILFNKEEKGHKGEMWKADSD